MHKIVLCFVLALSTVISHAHNGHRPDGHAPIGVMSDHTHLKGEYMVSVRHMAMEMEDIIDEADEISQDDYFSETSYMMAPKKMKMDMKMLGIMYAPTDHYTLAVMLPYISKDMKMTRKMNREEVETHNEGIGDLTFNVLRSLIETQEARLVAFIGLKLPTGEIAKYDLGGQLPYGMQLGSGSYGLNIGTTYTAFKDNWSWGGQLALTKYLNENSEEYILGTTYLGNLWGAYLINNNFSTSLRYKINIKDPISSNEDDISMMSPAFDPKNYHGQRHYALVGFNYIGTTFLKGHRFALEYAMPTSQNLSGYQLKSLPSFTLGWQKAF